MKDKILKGIAVNTIINKLFFVDVLVVVLHILWGDKTYLFNMDWERNIPTMYQSFKMVFAGGIIFCVWLLYKFLKEEKNRKLLSFWLGTSILVILMGFDEGAELHENVPNYFREIIPDFSRWYENIFSSLGFESSIWIVYVLFFFLPIVVVWLIYIFPEVWKVYGKRVYPLILAVIVFFAGALGMEFVSTIGEIWHSSWYEVTMVIEEFLEMLGGTIFMYFGLQELSFAVRKVKEKIMFQLID
jgi:hypothetical protein